MEIRECDERIPDMGRSTGVGAPAPGASSEDGGQNEKINGLLQALGKATVMRLIDNKRIGQILRVDSAGRE